MLPDCSSNILVRLHPSAMASLAMYGSITAAVFLPHQGDTSHGDMPRMSCLASTSGAVASLHSSTVSVCSVGVLLFRMPFTLEKPRIR